MASDVPSRIAFPLHTSVELFQDRPTPSARSRLKQAAVLFDEVHVECGLLEVSISDDFSNSWWLPPDAVTREQREERRSTAAAAAGQRVTVSFTPDEDNASDPLPDLVMEGPLLRSFVAEFHTDVLDDLTPLAPSWLKTFGTGSGALEGELGRVQGRLDRQDMGQPVLLPDLTGFEREYVRKAFNRDAVIAATLGAAIGVTPLFAPVAERRAMSQVQATGHDAVTILAPDLADVPWETILEFREHPGATEARDQLREFERLAIEAGPEDAAHYLTRVAQEVTRAHNATFEEMRPRLFDELARQLLGNAVALIPMVGPGLTTALSLADTAREEWEFQRSWTAALMTLRP